MSIETPPTQLWIGKHDQLVDAVYTYLETVFLVEQGSVASTQIRDRQHHAVRWLRPEKNQYRRVDLEPLFHELAFALPVQSQFFFILEAADTLTTVCANSLLKSLEEPPAGYHFILLVERRELVLPTVMSRSVIREFADQDMLAEQDSFYVLFKNPSHATHAKMMQELEKVKITEYQSRLVLDKLWSYWLEQRNEALKLEKNQDVQRAERMVRILEYASERLPMPGSVKIFWRNLFLMMSV